MEYNFGANDNALVKLKCWSYRKAFLIELAFLLQVLQT